MAVAQVVRTLGLLPGDSVVLSPLARGYWKAGLAAAGIRCLWADVGLESPVLSWESVSEVVDGCVKAVILDTCLGYQPDYESFRGKLPFLIHDFSQGIGGTQNEQPLWGFGDVVFVGFSNDSLLAGPGGCAVSFRGAAAAAEWLDALAVAPWEKMSDVGASLVLSQWSDIPELAEGKRSHARYLFQRLAKQYSQPRNFGDSVAVGPYFPVLVDSSPKEVISFGRRHAVEVEWAFREDGEQGNTEALANCPHARRFVAHTLAFPLYSVFGSQELENLGKVLASLP